MQLTNPTADLVARTVREFVGRSAADLSAYWLAVGGSREEYGAELGALLALDGMPVLIVRKQRFDNANYLSEDLAHILEENREAVLEALRRDGLRPTALPSSCWPAPSS